MSKSTFANKLPGELSKDLAMVGEQIRLARLRRDLYVLGLHKDVLLLAQQDPLGRSLQDIKLPHRERASKKI